MDGWPPGCRTTAGRRGGGPHLATACSPTPACSSASPSAGDTIVAAGSTGPADTLQPDAWRSTDDGRTWARVRRGLQGSENYGLFEISTVTPATIVAIGYDADTDHDVVAALAGDHWVTSDKVASKADIEYIDDVVATADGAMMFGRHERGGSNGDLQVAAVTIRPTDGS